MCTDHKSLVDCHVGLSKVACNRITRWCQKIGAFDIQLEYFPGVKNDVADLLSRSLKIPDSAWKSMDVIDSNDFEYSPLLALCPQYFHYVHLFNHSMDSDTIEIDDQDSGFNEINDAESWYPHERHLMGMTRVDHTVSTMSSVPATSNFITEADYLCCPDFNQIYVAVSVKSGTSSQEMSRKQDSAKEIIADRYQSLQQLLPDANKYNDKAVQKMIFQYSIEGGFLYFHSVKHGHVLCLPNVYRDDGRHLRQVMLCVRK